VNVINYLCNVGALCLRIAVKRLGGKGLGKIPVISSIYYSLIKLFCHSVSRVDVEGIGVFYVPSVSLLDYESYEPFTLQLFKRTIATGMTVVDLGAYIRYFTIIASQLVGKSGKVYSFEPESSSYALLTQNIETNNCYNVIPVKKAVANQPGAVAFFLDPHRPARSSLFPYRKRIQKKENRIFVETVRLDDFLANEHCDRVHVVKIDIEGAEL